MKSFIVNALIVLVVLVVLFGIAVGGFYLKRNINYKLGYERIVQTQIDKSIADHVRRYHDVGTKDSR